MDEQCLRILLIEDSLAEARLIQEILMGIQPINCELVHVKRLGEALELLDRQKFDIILLDLTLPSLPVKPCLFKARIQGRC
jgi:CheY-like chemotaxis protein